MSLVIREGFESHRRSMQGQGKARKCQEKRAIEFKGEGGLSKEEVQGQGK